MRLSPLKIFFAISLLGLSACEDGQVRYVLEQGLMQGALLLKSKSIETTLRNPRLAPPLRQKLLLAQEVLNYAQNELHMNTGNSYRKFYDLQRPWLTQAVIAAPRDRLEPHYFEFPIVGQVPYQGFFKLADAEAFARTLEKKDLDVSVRPVNAFSSLGWFSDPVLNTMLVSDAYLIELILHELVHLNFYFKSEADFNEAFATWFSHQNAAKFLAGCKNCTDVAATRAQMRDNIERQERFSQLMTEAMREGRAIYAAATPATLTEVRARFFGELKNKLVAAGFPQLAQDDWNNAKIVSAATYFTLIPAIESYAVKMKLDATAFLSRVIQSGPGIVPQVTAH